MKKLVIIFIVLMVLGIGPQAFAANWYVDNSVGSSGNGQAWATAWKNFSNINYASVSCGDTIYISGGATGSSQTYAERLSVNKTCTEGNPLTITVGTDASHNGTVKITGTAGLYYGINIPSKNWITIDGQSNNDGQRHIEIYQNAACAATNNCVNTGIYISGTSVGAKLKYIYLHDVGLVNNDYTTAVTWGLTNSTYATGHDISYCYIEKTIDGINVGQSGGIKPTAYGGVKIHHNYIKAYDDGIQANVSTDIYNNTITRDAYVGKGHPDGIQVYGSYTRIFNNIITGFLDQQSGNSAVYWEPDGGENMDHNEHKPCCFQVYNNVFSETGTASTSITAISLGISDTRFLSLDDVQIINNTFKGKYSNALVFDTAGSKLDINNVSNIKIINNLFYNAAKSGGYMLALKIADIANPVTFGSYGSGANVVVDYNSYYSDISTKVAYLGREYSYENFLTTSGSQAHGVTADPKLNTDLTLQNMSPCINAIPTASAPTSLLTYAGRVLIGAGWDIGAYEAPVSVTAPPPAPAPAQASALVPPPPPAPAPDVVTPPPVTKSWWRRLLKR